MQSQNERMFLVTFLVLSTGRTEQGLMSSLPLADCQIEIQRGLTTSSTAIFIPFTTQELYQSGKESLYPDLQLWLYQSADWRCRGQQEYSAFYG